MKAASTPRGVELANLARDSGAQSSGRICSAQSRALGRWASLAEALELVCLLAEVAPEKLDGYARRFVVRLADERRFRLAELDLAVTCAPGTAVATSTRFTPRPAPAWTGVRLSERRHAMV
jgi:hypothetical protein